MANRYVPKSAQEVLDSFEWLYREKLEQLDAMTRQLWSELRYAGVKQADIPQVIGDWFKDLARNVAEVEEERQRGRGA